MEKESVNPSDYKSILKNAYPVAILVGIIGIITVVFVSVNYDLNPFDIIKVMWKTLCSIFHVAGIDLSAL